MITFLNNFGIGVDESTPYFIILSGDFLVLSVFVFLNIINIIIYLASIYIVSNEKFLSKIPKEYAYVHKFLLYYKNIRVIYIIIEFIFVIFCLLIMILFTYSLVSYYINYK